MTVVLTDEEIKSLIGEEKRIPPDFFPTFHLVRKGGHREGKKDLSGSQGNHFRVIVRQGCFNHLDFSIGLLYFPKNSNKAFILKKYNGKSHQHTNKIEKETFYDFHIHTATERYQEEGIDCEDGYAIVSDRYCEITGAMRCMEEDCGFVIQTDNVTLDVFGVNNDE
ncbi:conserved hypothetical protein [Methanospirillum hungatei JF-1]|jgi:hypothetical protein|uniref:Uncharacterized protein n=1 Tax=Methanospirillum hungatei JF-1 (strain ATCC 27890 / DSM 864 / NBRC 100397 / JF-1) TaxID=323259 RepID=Q2FL04_METHJ|nr:hypothetical protein [Methanospirillum hungatei]ABD41396.1 conserved hypothetical protein [Methanospirillum hungatei JF-1]MBP9007582.1 hypothetical protein [Methanospirillum sp.]HOW04330.1 hypothetical protein [Methanospirillum hungatei]